MADLSITAAQVLPGPNATIERGLAGVAITAGQVGYLDTTPNTYKPWDANRAAANTRPPVIALNDAAAGQPIAVATGGDVTLGAGAAPAVGTIYVGSATAGGIAPAADLATGHVVAVIGVGKATNAVA